MSDDDSSEDAEFTDREDEEFEEPKEEPETPQEDTAQSPAGGGRRAKREISYAEQNDDDGGNDDDDESDDDIPLSELAGKKPAAASNGGASKKKKKAPTAASPKKKPRKAANGTKKAAPAAKKPPPSSSKGFDYASAALYQTEKCVKGELIQRLLCRWWYAYEWPAKPAEDPPANYDALDGFPGVYVCTSGDNVGHILDTRDMSTKPSFRNFAHKSSAELKDLLVKAIDGQLSVLENQEHAHDTTDVQKELKEMRKWVKRVNADTADRDANKVLKASKLELPD